jgi:hypothetical protein
MPNQRNVKRVELEVGIPTTTLACYTKCQRVYRERNLSDR